MVTFVAAGVVLGVERTLLPLMAGPVFDQHSHTATFSFIITFGICKAVTNSLVGALADKVSAASMVSFGRLTA